LSPMMKAVLTACAVLAYVSASPLRRELTMPASSQDLTVYHLNPRSAGAKPVNMDTGDALGDLYFYLGEFLLPLECNSSTSTKESRAHFDCDNPERFGSDLVVTRVQMQVDSSFTQYSACNLCNGTDPFTRKPCTKGTYICDCESRGGGCSATKVGMENVTQHFAPSTPSAKCASALQDKCQGAKSGMDQCFGCILKHYLSLKFAGCKDSDIQGFCPNPFNNCTKEGPDWMCWSVNIPRKTGGFWYSTLAAGEGTGWKVESIKTIQEPCLKDHLMSTVESSDKQGCFAGCGARNTTDSCWIGCFFDTLLGHEARDSTKHPLGGMDIVAIESGWTGAFKPVSEGGCQELS